MATSLPVRQATSPAPLRADGDDATATMAPLAYTGQRSLSRNDHTKDDDSVGCFMKSVPRSVPPPVPQDCIVFGHCAYDFDGTEYGHEYLVLPRSEVVVYLNQEDQQWLLGRRACWKNNTLHHPNSDGSLLLGWFPPSCVTSWTIWRPEPNHAVRALHGFFVQSGLECNMAWSAHHVDSQATSLPVRQVTSPAPSRADSEAYLNIYR